MFNLLNFSHCTVFVWYHVVLTNMTRAKGFVAIHIGAWHRRLWFTCISMNKEYCQLIGLSAINLSLAVFTIEAIFFPFTVQWINCQCWIQFMGRLGTVYWFIVSRIFQKVMNEFSWNFWKGYSGPCEQNPDIVFST